jgi:transposase
MERTRRRFTKEFKVEAVKVVKEGDKSVYQVAMDMGLAHSVLQRWVKQSDIDYGQGPPGALTTAEREELRRLRRENTQLKMERDFLKKAAAFFAKENQ